jgi:hypothetical protein
MRYWPTRSPPACQRLNLLPPNASVPRLTVEYDDDPTGAADALLAALKQPRASAGPENDEHDDDAADAA